MKVGTALDRTALLVQMDLYPSLDFLQIIDGLTSTTVRLRLEGSDIKDPGLQTMLVTTAIVCAQSGARLLLDMPDAPLAVRQPPLFGGELVPGLVEATSALVWPALLDDSTPADFTMLLGNASTKAGDGFTVRVSGDSWHWRVSEPNVSPLRGDYTAPFGYVAAGLAAGAEAFRVAMRRLAQIHQIKPLAQHRIDRFIPVDGALPTIPLGGAVALGQADVISAGAITTGLLFVLLRGTSDLR